jgi:hypothetical protein
MVTVIFTESRCLGSISNTARTRASNSGSLVHAAAEAQPAFHDIWKGTKRFSISTFSEAARVHSIPCPVAAGLAANNRHTSGASANWSHGPGSDDCRNALPDNAIADVLSRLWAVAIASFRLVINAVGSKRYGTYSLG